MTYGKEGGHIWMKLSAGEGVATLQVRDDGVGIAPDQLPKIWERFYQVDPARSGESSGLGLSMVRWIVQAHGGTVQAESALGRAPPSPRGCPWAARRENKGKRLPPAAAAFAPRGG